MAKSKNKPLKQYKVPRENFLVVVDAWGLIGDFSQSDFNQIGAWFEIMLAENYPKTRINSIYYQRTHRNIIVELPREVEDTNQYLGAHFYGRFLTNDAGSDRKVLIYEYKYASFGDPGERNWSIGYPNYTSIPPDIPIRRPFPLLPFPAPLPTSDIPYARQISAEVVAANQNKHILQATPRAEATSSISTPASDPRTCFKASQPPNTESSPNPSSSHARESNESLRPSSNPIPNYPESPQAGDKGKSRTVMPPPSIGTFTPYVAPSHLSSHLKKSIPHDLSTAALGNQIVKRDPYEEDEESRDILRSPQPIKEEEADDFLSSFLPSVKRKEEIRIKSEGEDDYQPSAELLAALNALPPELFDGGMEVSEEKEELRPRVKPEPIEHQIDDYYPSDALLSAFAELPSEMKLEHGIDDYQPSDELLAELSSLPSDLLDSLNEDVPVKKEQDGHDNFDRRELHPRVKQEPVEDVLPHTFHRSSQSSAAPLLSDSRHRPASQSHIQVKSEPMDDGYPLKHPSPLNRPSFRQVDYDASRDPRIKRLDLPPSSSSKRNGGHLASVKANTSKRLKKEYLDG